MMSVRAHCLRLRVPARAGFTIIEVVVVMLILAVATAITVPALLPPPADDDLTVAAAQFDRLFAIARDSASRSGADVTLMIDSATGGVWLMSQAGPDTTFPSTPDSAFGSARMHAAGEPLDLPASVRLQLSKSRARFRFSATGAAFADSLVLSTPAGEHLVTIDPWNGHATIQ
ncbi:MAG TPA: GspH/FimT family pseudopilin [Longimicrobiales bacterium]|nr:GspH/FimT family pseudopilin [Longimicrobiales bacterium]